MSRLPLLLTLAAILAGCSGERFTDADYVSLTVDLALVGSARHDTPPPADPELRRRWNEERVAGLMDAYGITEEEYLEFSLDLHQDHDRYNRVLQDIADEFLRRDQELKDLEAPEEVRRPPGSFG